MRITDQASTGPYVLKERDAGPVEAYTASATIEDGVPEASEPHRPFEVDFIEAQWFAGREGCWDLAWVHAHGPSLRHDGTLGTTRRMRNWEELTHAPGWVRDWVRTAAPQIRPTTPLC